MKSSLSGIHYRAGVLCLLVLGQTVVAQDEQDAATFEMWRIAGSFGDPKVPRTKLLERFEAALKRYPNGEHVEEAKKSIGILKKMIAEDEARARKAPKAVEKMTKEERVADLIFQLREQNGRQIFNPGRCDVFGHFGGFHFGDSNTPAYQLVLFGYDAVPQLIDALSDERFSRSVGFRNGYCYVLHVGDCARAVLEAISGRYFYHPRSSTSEMIKDGETAKVKKTIQAWWEEAQKKGEKRMLIEGVEVGDYQSTDHAYQLIMKFPEAAIDAIRTGARKTTQSSDRSNLVYAAHDLKGEKAEAFFLEELKGPWHDARVAAASALSKRGRPEGVQTMIREWKELSAENSSRGGYPDDRTQAVIRFLANSCRLEAVEALAADLVKRPVSQRIEVVMEVGGMYLTKKDKPLEPKVQKAVEDLLAGRLSDKEQCLGRSGSYPDPRVCDMAALQLADRWKLPNAFDSKATLEVRDRQVAEMQNLWRKRHMGDKP